MFLAMTYKKRQMSCTILFCHCCMSHGKSLAEFSMDKIGRLTTGRLLCHQKLSQALMEDSYACGHASHSMPKSVNFTRLVFVSWSDNLVVT